ncbi:MAG: hypothetical protein Tsb002_33730 [Wenzhouxiangellaceae bacterium]
MNAIVRILGLCCFIVCQSAISSELSEDQYASAIEAIGRQLETAYVIPAEGKLIAQALRGAWATSEINHENAAQFAAEVTRILQSVNQDGHLSLKADVSANAALLQSDTVEEADDDYWLQQARAENWGIEAYRRLPGNIAYLNLTGFWDVGPGREKLAAALRLMEDAAGVVIDLRYNGGGSPQMVAFLTSYFVSDQRLLMTFYDGLTQQSSESHAMATVPGRRLSGMPLYVLTSAGTGSAAEEFASHVRWFELGTLVGQPTYGAAYNNSLLPIASEFVLSLSTGMPVHPVSKGNWEAEGVQPHHVTSADAALAVAHAQLLKDLIAAKPAGDEAQALRWYLTYLEVLQQPHSISAAQQRCMVGVYGTDREITWVDDELKYRRSGRPASRLVALDDSTFVLHDNADIRLRLASAESDCDTLELRTVDGSVVRYSRPDK